MELIDRKPIEDVSLVELFEHTIEFRESRYDAILDFADRFRKTHPTIYDNEYEFLELKLTEHAFDTMDKKLIDRCLGVIARDPVRGIETVTIVTLYRLLCHGMYEEALAYSQTVWERIATDDDLWGYPELPFIMTIPKNLTTSWEAIIWSCSLRYGGCIMYTGSCLNTEGTSHAPAAVVKNTKSVAARQNNLSILRINIKFVSVC